MNGGSAGIGAIPGHRCPDRADVLFRGSGRVYLHLPGFVFDKPFPSMPTDHLQDLRRILAGNASFMAILRAVRAAALPQGCVGAGAVRSLIWDALHGQPRWTMRGDVDVAYFDGADLSDASQSAYLARLRHIEPDVPWEVVNQAGVHLWYERHFGFTVAPLSSLEQAVATWPEFATCVAVRLAADGRIEVVAPWGLEDLFSMTVRHNPARASLAEYRRRAEAKRYADIWPRVTVV